MYLLKHISVKVSAGIIQTSIPVSRLYTNEQQTLGVKEKGYGIGKRENYIWRIQLNSITKTT